MEVDSDDTYTAATSTSTLPVSRRIDCFIAKPIRCDRRRRSSIIYSLTDNLLAAFAMFSLKEPSLLVFQERKDEPAIKKLYQIKNVPSDSSMGEILDGTDLEQLNQSFADIVHELQRGQRFPVS